MANVGGAIEGTSTDDEAGALSSGAEPVGFTAGILNSVANVGGAIEGTSTDDADGAPSSGTESVGFTAGILNSVAKVGGAIEGMIDGAGCSSDVGSVGFT
ncbi:MAG: hypothetical protein ACJ786_11045, partial [Catenulispora sp.]